MGTVKKIGGEYYIEFEARGLKYQQKAGIDEKAAYRLLDEIEGKIKQGQMGTMTRDVDPDIFFADFKEYASAQHTAKTVGRFAALIDHFYGFLRADGPPVNKLSQITPIVLEQYKIYLQKKADIPGRPANRAKVVNLSFFLLAEIFQYAIKLGYLNDNPTLHIRLLKIPAGPRPRGLTEGELQSIRQKSAPFLKTIVEFILLTGVRWPELVEIQWADIDRAKGVMKIGRESSRREMPQTFKIIEVVDAIDKTKSADAVNVFTDSAGRPLSAQSLCLQFLLRKSPLPRPI